MSHHTRLWAHTRWALFCFILLATALDRAHWDQLIAHRLYFDAATAHWRGASDFWIDSVTSTLHCASDTHGSRAGASVLLY